MINFHNPTLSVMVGSCAASLIVLTFILLHRRRNSLVNAESNQTTSQTIDRNITDPTHEEQQVTLSIKFEDLPALTEAEEARLVEVRDNKLIAKVDLVIPGTFQVISNTVAIHNYNQALQSAGPLYHAVIPKGAVLSQSRSMDGAVRAIYHDGKNISGHANLVAVDGNMGNGLSAVGMTNAAMGIASMIVGQYYMTQISNRLDIISNGIKQIADFQDNEYKSKVYALIAEIQKSSTFQMEIIENDELRNRELTHLRTLEHECSELLGQANITLQDFSKKKEISYKDYEKSVAATNKWFQYQQILLDIMEKISELTYVLNLGALSKDCCYGIYIPYAKQAENTLNMLNEWHSKNINQFEIDTHSARRKRQRLEKLISSVPALFNDDWNYRDIPKHTALMIIQQSHAVVDVKPDAKSDFFQEEVELIVKDGKLYYLPPTEDEKLT